MDVRLGTLYIFHTSSSDHRSKPANDYENFTRFFFFCWYLSGTAWSLLFLDPLIHFATLYLVQFHPEPKSYQLPCGKMLGIIATRPMTSDRLLISIWPARDESPEFHL